jgi:hypothetical protein
MALGSVLMAEDPRSILERNKRLLADRAKTQESEELLEKLPQGHGSGLNADMVDGLHAAEIIARAPGKGGGGGGSGSGSGDMTKAVYDQNDNDVVDNSEKIEGKTLSEVQDHTPKAHTLASHSTKAHSELTGVTEDQHHAKVHGDVEHSVAYEKTTNKGVANGYAELDVDTLVLLARLPTIPYNKLSLALSIVNADIAAAAAIAESKLALNYSTHAENHKDRHKSGGADAFTSTDLLEAIVKRLQESSGPTNLLMGSIADGQYLKRSGTGIIGDIPAGGGTHDILSATHTDTLAASCVAGDIIIANTTPKWSRLAKGTLNYVLKMGATLPGWGQVDWGELTSKPSTFPPSAHDHLNDHLKPTTIGKIPTTSTPTILYLYTKDYLGDPGSNKFLPEDSGYGYLGDATHFWAGVYANYVNVNGNLVVLSLRDPGAGTHYFSYAASTHSTLRPATADYSYVGTSAYYFNSVYADHVKYKEHSVFDALDDIALVRKIKAHKTEITKKGLPSVDYSTVPDELKAYEPEDIVDEDGILQQPAGTHEFMDLGALCGLLTGAVKQLADKVDDLQARLKKLEKGG